MTQKELLYLEDAISHEQIIIKICNESLKSIEDENLVSFIEKEIEKHTSLKELLMNKLEEKSNE
ncbi:MAG: hypothetical protein IKF19_05060 [Bacilli bacterium]|nr:hypothetical protein [Bacilli bacterium]